MPDNPMGAGESRRGERVISVDSSEIPGFAFSNVKSLFKSLESLLGVLDRIDYFWDDEIFESNESTMEKRNDESNEKKEPKIYYTIEYATWSHTNEPAPSPISRLGTLNEKKQDSARIWDNRINRYNKLRVIDSILIYKIDTLRTKK